MQDAHTADGAGEQEQQQNSRLPEAGGREGKPPRRETPAPPVYQPAAHGPASSPPTAAQPGAGSTAAERCWPSHAPALQPAWPVRRVRSKRSAICLHFLLFHPSLTAPII